MILFDTKDIDNAVKAGDKLCASAITNEPSTEGEHTFVRSKTHELMLKIFGQIKSNNTIEFCTAGEFSTHQLLQYLLTFTGPANVYLSTWTLKEEPARVLYFLKKTGKIKQLNCVFDYRIRTLDAKHFDFLEKIIDKYMLTKCHAKVLAIEGENMSIAVISSANMSNNPRIESGVIMCNKTSVEFHKGWITDIVNGKKVA